MINKKETKVAKALRIPSDKNVQQYINMDTILNFTVDADDKRLDIEVMGDYGYIITTDYNADHFSDRSVWTVPINEFHRIKRELGEFMGVNLHTKNPESVKITFI